MDKIYSTPEQYFYRCAFPRGRLLSQLEDDLTLFIQLIMKNAGKPVEVFNRDFDEEYSKYHSVTEKTVANHRTEMTTLFGLIYLSPEGFIEATDRTKSLWEKQDFYVFFKSFADKFQFPNAINNSHNTIEQIERGIKFKPAQYILKLMVLAVNKYGGDFSVSGSEISNLIFNDLRVTTGKIKPEELLETLIHYRTQKIRYEASSNLSQHGREFLGYLVLANLLSQDETNTTFKLNINEKESIDSIINSDAFFEFPSDYTSSVDVRKKTDLEWDMWFGGLSKLEESRLSTPVSAFKDIIEKDVLSEEAPLPITSDLKNIGDLGENIVLKYERDKIKSIRPDKAGLVARVSHDTTLGYDIQSLEFEDLDVKKHIEVKTTNRTYPPDAQILTWFPMSINEWNTAKSYQNSYYIYRVFLVNKNVKLFIVKNPTDKESRGLIVLEPTGFKVILNKGSGEFADDISL